ncbi:type IV pilus modification PilV family protein [Halanaerobium congolense]|uniref:type IV pilus modification PilV family protein n=1 Tax=Halanaerobium congolense TaxID=54121 RepID=UPI00091506D2|nr:prepilin-type N-terminal cleavage/methylation domain-containing protein [Halanaerobium congolense]SHM24196.1 prepilin-type N-terminal cleavage/methylation domain-containing protein [Halanaerobium congolense]
MNKESSGFSLIEVMAAIVILTLAFFPVIAYFTNSIGFVTQREILSEANDITVNTMEYLKKESEKNWDDLLFTSLDNYSFGDYKYFSKDNLITNSTIEYYVYELDEGSYVLVSSDQNDADFARVTLRLTWDDNKDYILTSVLKARSGE